MSDLRHLRHASLKMDFPAPNEKEWKRHWLGIIDKI
jgi:hypothetical protein